MSSEAWAETRTLSRSCKDAAADVECKKLSMHGLVKCMSRRIAQLQAYLGQSDTHVFWVPLSVRFYVIRSRKYLLLLKLAARRACCFKDTGPQETWRALRPAIASPDAWGGGAAREHAKRS